MNPDSVVGSQGLYAERAVILADLVLDDKSYGPHLFWAPIADFQDTSTRPSPRTGVTIESLPRKTAMRGLDNAAISFDNFRVSRSALLSRFGSVDAEGSYSPNLPEGVPRMVDLLISRLLTGRIVLSEATLAHAMSRTRRSWTYATERELWRGRKERGPMMSTMPLIRSGFRDYSRTAAIVSAFVAHTRERVAIAIKTDKFPAELIEATCMCKFLGTGFGVDCVSAIRKMMGARALHEDSWLGDESFLPNATSAAEGDNTIMELKIVQDIVRGRTSKLPVGLMARASKCAAGRYVCVVYMRQMGSAMLLGRKALKAGQLLRDIAWARAHMRVIDVWLSTAGSEKVGWLDSYQTVLPFPTRLQA